MRVLDTGILTQEDIMRVYIPLFLMYGLSLRSIVEDAEGKLSRLRSAISVAAYLADDSRTEQVCQAAAVLIQAIQD